jgi:hypothetical protein
VLLRAAQHRLEAPLRATRRRMKRVHKDDPEQSRRFIKTARELGVSEDTSAADELLGHLYKKPPEPRAKKEKRR